MIDLINGLQNGKGGEGLDKLMANSSEKNPLEAQKFQELLGQAQTSENPQASLENLLSQNQKTLKETSILNNSNDLAEKLLSSNGQEGEASLETAGAEGNAKTLESGESEVQTKSEGSTLLSLLTGTSGEGKVATQESLQNLKTSGELRFGANAALNNNAQTKLELPTQLASNEATPLAQAPKGMLKDMLATANAKDSSEFIDPRFGPALTQASPKKMSKPNSTTQIQYSEDFMSQRVESNGDGTPRVTGSKSALNMFEKEHSVLNDTGMFNKKSFNKMSSEKTVFDSASTEQMTSTIDKSANFNESLLSSTNGVMGVKKEISDVGISTSTDVKALDLSAINNPEKLLKEISNYIENSRIQNGKELEVLVKHNELGNFKVNATKSDGGMIDLQIIAGSEEAHAFFSKNEVNLLKTLNSSGLKISDFKLATADSSSTSSNGNNSADQNNSGNGQGFGRQSNSENSHQQGRQKRQELWDDYRQKLGA